MLSSSKWRICDAKLKWVGSKPYVKILSGFVDQVLKVNRKIFAYKSISGISGKSGILSNGQGGINLTKHKDYKFKYGLG